MPSNTPARAKVSNRIRKALRSLLIGLVAVFAGIGGLAGPDATGEALAQSRDGAAPIYLHNAHLYDATMSEPSPPRTIVIRDGRIAEISEETSAPPEDATVVDLEGRFVLPGLFDMHAHPADLDAIERALRSGVTTLRSMSVDGFTDVAMRDLVRSGKIAGPGILAAGVFVQPRLPRNGAILKDPRLAQFIDREVWSPDDLATLVNIDIDRGVDWIKTRATERGGLKETDPRQQVYTESELRVIVETAAARDVPVAVHAHGDEGMRAAVLAGARSIEHGTYASPETIAEMVERGTYLVPTIAVVRDLSEVGGDYDSPVLQIRGRHMLPTVRQMAANAKAAGVTILPGTDTSYQPHGTLRLGHELEEFVGIGLTPHEAIRAATLDAAEMMGLADRTGRLATGFEADIIVVDGNPLQDIRQVQDVLLVISNGHLAVNRLPFGRQ